MHEKSWIICEAEWPVTSQGNGWAIDASLVFIVKKFIVKNISFHIVPLWYNVKLVINIIEYFIFLVTSSVYWYVKFIFTNIIKTNFICTIIIIIERLFVSYE